MHSQRVAGQIAVVSSNARWHKAAAAQVVTVHRGRSSTS
jgi:hypothetical protein